MASALAYGRKVYDTPNDKGWIEVEKTIKTQGNRLNAIVMEHIRDDWYCGISEVLTCEPNRMYKVRIYIEPISEEAEVAREEKEWEKERQKRNMKPAEIH